MDLSKNKALSEELERINQQKEQLNRLYRITISLKQLKESLQAALCLGESSIDKLTSWALSLVDTFNRQIKNFSTVQIKKQLSALEYTIKSDLKSILYLTSENIETHNFEDELEQNNELINHFYRKAKTSVAMKVLLSKHGIISDDLKLPVSEDEVQNRLIKLREKENKYEARFRQEIQSFDDNLVNVIKNKDCPENLRQQLASIHGSLSSGISHLEDGESLEDISFNFDVIEIRESLPEDEQTLDEVPSDTLDNENRKGTPESNSLGFVQKLSIWLNTSLDVSWKKIKKNK
ncbi:MAG: hypothetical protein GY694_04295 [Gammaproteobacteria bacterium]|nr:hypothetical protein [Gammaproteobacteria bacterium]